MYTYILCVKQKIGGIMKERIRPILVDCFRLYSKINPRFAIKVRLKAKYQHEKEFFEKYFEDFTKQDDYEEKLEKFLENLDENSKTTIKTIISRYHAYFEEGRITNYDLFTKEEIEQLMDLQINFHNKTEKLSDTIYRYKEYVFPVRNFEASVLYYKHGISEIEQEHLNTLHEKSIIDVGGFIGDSILVLNELEPKNIYSFEAISHHYELLKKTLTINKIENVIPVNHALGSHTGTTTMSVAESISSIVDMGDIDSVLVDMITLDNYVEKHKIEVGLIKVDIEGAETGFIRGSIETIKSQKPVILLSIYHNTHDFLELKTIIEELDLGYKFKIYKPVDGAIMLETLLICQV